MSAEKSPDKLLDGLVSKLREAAGENLVSVILYGSAVAGGFHPGVSNLNVFCVLQDASFSALRALEPVAKWWDGQKQPPPLIMTRQELERSADVFAIEWLDMKASHRVLHGSDVLEQLHIPMHLHRVQVEYELREKLVLLRQKLLLLARNDEKMWDLVLHSAPSFLTLFRHALIAMQEAPPATKAEVVQALAKRAGFDPSGMLEVLELRQRRAHAGEFDVSSLCARYLAAIEHVTAAVDTIMDSGSPNS
ncbi:MAG: hypothetical protein JST79_07975 [Acidobacteria bacterium]|nr:hypothetical protein [Acidobacteriota bacterium]